MYVTALNNEYIVRIIGIGVKIVDKQGLTRVNVFDTVLVELTPEFLESLIVPITSTLNVDAVEKIVKSVYIPTSN